MISMKDLYWAAGFMEGEGAFGYYKGSLELQVAQVHKPPVEKLKELFGGQLRQQIKRDKPHWQPSWHWQPAGKRAAGIMMTVYSLMSPKRQGQIKKALLGWRARERGPGKGERRAYCKRGHKMDWWNRKGGENGPGGCKECARNSKRRKAVKRNYGDLSTQGRLAF